MATPERLKELVREYYDLIDGQDLEAAAKMLAPQYVAHIPNYTGFKDPGKPNDRARIYFNAFPDFRHVIEDQIVEGNVVVDRIRYFGTHRGEFMGIPATGREVTWTGTDIVTFDGELVAKRFGLSDQLGLRRQLLGES